MEYKYHGARSIHKLEPGTPITDALFDELREPKTNIGIFINSFGTAENLRKAAEEHMGKTKVRRSPPKRHPIYLLYKAHENKVFRGTLDREALFAKRSEQKWLKEQAELNKELEWTRTIVQATRQQEMGMAYKRKKGNRK
jgi:hypothetical protein